MTLDPDPFLTTGPARPRRTLVLAHGAGAPMDSDFMNVVADGLAGHEIRVVRFEFPYMAERRHSGRRKPPNTGRVLLEHYRGVVAGLGSAAELAIGGKSMGGRMASMVADELGVRAVVCLGYPFHPPGKPDNLRTEHLRELATPALIVQGERDTFGTRQEVKGYGLAQGIRLCWLPDGDHSFKPRVKSGHTLDQNLESAIDAVAEFLLGID